MTIILFTFIALVIFWLIGLWAAGYHVFSFHLPGDSSVAAFFVFLFLSGIIFLIVLNWFLATYFRGIL